MISFIIKILNQLAQTAVVFESNPFGALVVLVLALFAVVAFALYAMLRYRF